jgi:hypothetical protein
MTAMRTRIFHGTLPFRPDALLCLQQSRDVTIFSSVALRSVTSKMIRKVMLLTPKLSIRPVFQLSIWVLQTARSLLRSDGQLSGDTS